MENLNDWQILGISLLMSVIGFLILFLVNVRRHNEGYQPTDKIDTSNPPYDKE
jgi:hypothetical protein